MSDHLKNNPFAGLFSDVADVDSHLLNVRETTYGLTKKYILGEDSVEGDKNGNYNEEDTDKNVELETNSDISNISILDKTAVEINCLIEEIFLFTLSKNPLSFKKGSLTRLLYLKELADVYPESLLDIENLEQVLFERLLIDDSNSSVLTSKTSGKFISENYLQEKECITYLAHCYIKVLEKEEELVSSKENKNTFSIMYNLIGRNVATALKQPELYENSQDLNQQILRVFETAIGSPNQLVRFFTSVVNEIEKDEPAGTLLRTFTPIFDLVHQNLAQTNVLVFPTSNFALLKGFASVPKLAEALLTHSTPKDTKLGIAFANTLLGSAFSLSCLPKTPDGLYEFFDKPQSTVFTAVELNLWTAMSSLGDMLYEVFLALLKQTRQQTLNWLGACIDANIHRGRLSAFAAYSPSLFACVSDGFALNLSAVLLRLAQPFIQLDNEKILLVDPTYPAVKVDAGSDHISRGIHMKCMAKETCLLPTEQDENRPTASSYNFVTECFYMAHRSIDIGLRVVLEHMQTTYKEFVRLQNSVNDANTQGNVELSNAIMEQIDVTTSRYFSMRCALLEPKALNLIGDLVTATSNWLIQVVVDDNTAENRTNYAPRSWRAFKFPLPTHIPDTLKCVPEMLLENAASYLVLLKRFSPVMLETSSLSVHGTDASNLSPVLTMLLVFMSSNQRARNPHLRARLAECLECIIPRNDDSNTVTAYNRENLFRQHAHRNEIVRCLLDVFVGIEMTGESVSFEQKFNYRRPMYAVMSFLWEMPEHRANFKKLSVEAEESMEGVTPPLFLRFLNLLMNDAIFLLDEALSNMAQLRTMQTARENGEWDNLPASERDRNALHFQQIGMTARIDNILGQETIQALEYLSSEIKSIFCHPMMSDRVAAMLNYFLAHLVGPKMKNFKVKDQTEYKFDPAAIVLNICKIYIHLSESDEFCAAVSKDGRSYNPQLFQQAHDVLVRINGSALIGDLIRTAERVQKFANLQKAEEEVLADVPDEFLDPIMSTLMTDPVILPSSRITIDRPTIARHLLSDQSDPFNRSLLTMDMITSNTELKGRIEKWLAEKRNSGAAGEGQGTSDDTAAKEDKL